MKFDQALYEITLPAARKTTVKTVVLGLGFTGVMTGSGDTGVAYTYLSEKKSCTVAPGFIDYEGKPAILLLEEILKESYYERAAALALINALNRPRALTLPEDRNSLITGMGIGPGTITAMVGFMAPLAERVKESGSTLRLIDEGKGIGMEDQEGFHTSLGEADALILTSTSIINRSAGPIIERLKPGAGCVMIGPSTPMLPELFELFPLTCLGGMVQLDPEQAMKEIRHGKGTPAIRKCSRKIFICR